MGELAHGTVLGDYRIEDVLGRGAMSTVYRAERVRLGQLVALKIVDPGLAQDEAMRVRFEREWRLAASLRHPNIVPLVDAGEVNGLLYLAMVYVEGSDLRHLLEQEGALAPPRAIALLTQVASALDAAHAKGLVHRDVKPANILVASAPTGGGGEHVYLADFGLTKQINSASRLSRQGSFTGTLEYAAPEQFQGGPIDGRADIYALGCVLYECLTGDVPFPRDSEAALMHAHLYEPVPSVRLLKPGLPAALDAVIATGTARDPAHRHASAGALITAAQRALAPAVPDTERMPTNDAAQFPRGGTLVDSLEHAEPKPPPPPARRPRTDMNRVAFVVAGMIVAAGALLGGVWILNGDGSSLASGSTAQPTALVSATSDADALVRSLFAEVVAAVRRGDRVSMLPRLHKAVIDRYGEAACRRELSSPADPTYDIVVKEVLPAATWAYTTDDVTTLVEGTWSVKADVTMTGATTAQELHVASIDGEPRWFVADCGEPLLSAILGAVVPRAYGDTCAQVGASVDIWASSGVKWAIDCYPGRTGSATPGVGEELPGVVRYVLFDSGTSAIAWVSAIDGIASGASAPIAFQAGSEKCEVSPGSSASGFYTLDQEEAGILKCFQVKDQASLVWTVDVARIAMWAVDEPQDVKPDAGAFFTWWKTATNWFTKEELPSGAP